MFEEKLDIEHFLTYDNDDWMNALATLLKYKFNLNGEIPWQSFLYVNENMAKVAYENDNKIKSQYITYDKYIENLHDEGLELFVHDVPKQGAFILVMGSIDDPIEVVVIDGKVVGAYYMSSRGSMWQAGAFIFNHETQSGNWYYSCNMRPEHPIGEWVPGRDIGSEVAYDMWETVEKFSHQHILADKPNTFWKNELTYDEWKVKQLKMFEKGLQQYAKGENLVARRKRKK